VGFEGINFHGFMLCLLHHLVVWLTWESICDGNLALEVKLEKKHYAIRTVSCQQLPKLVNEVSLSSNKDDRKHWVAESQGTYTVKSCTNILDGIEFSGIFSFASLLRKGIVPPKVQMFLYKGFFSLKKFNQMEPRCMSFLYWDKWAC